MKILISERQYNILKESESSITTDGNGNIRVGNFVYSVKGQKFGMYVPIKVGQVSPRPDGGYDLLITSPINQKTQLSSIRAKYVLSNIGKSEIISQAQTSDEKTFKLVKI
jgi:hypothetical protein